MSVPDVRTGRLLHSHSFYSDQLSAFAAKLSQPPASDHQPNPLHCVE